MLSREVLSAMGEWDIEVSSETARLIRSGIPPYEAASKAVEIVTRRRKKAAETLDIPCSSDIA
jgi:hypothetical protein